MLSDSSAFSEAAGANPDVDTNNPAAEALAKCKQDKSRKYSETYLKLGLYLNISYCEDMCIPTRTHLTYNNDKPWFIAKLR